MRLIFALAATAVLFVPANAGSRIDDPVAFVRNIYANWQDEQRIDDSKLLSPRLASLVALDDKEAGGEVGRGNDFSFWCNCQDGELKNAKVTGRDVENGKGRKVIDAKFELDGRKQEIFFYFEQGKDGWKLDDVRLAGKDGWTLSLILKYGWDDGK